MASNPDYELNFIGHGTNGSDGIEVGIHLRWAFPPKLGFPPGGVILQRRSLDYAQTMVCDTVLPAITKVAPAGAMFLPAGTWPQYFTYVFPCVADRVEITMNAKAGQDWYFVFYAGLLPYVPIHITGLPAGVHTFNFVDEGITKLVICGSQIEVQRICRYCCGSVAGLTWETLSLEQNGKLPSGLTAPLLATYYGVTDHNYAVALQRLNAAPTARPITPTDWAEMVPVLQQVASVDAVSVPVGWSVPPELLTSGSAAAGTPATNMSSGDLLGLTAMNKKISRAIGSYHIDGAALATRLYDYAISAVYPATHLADLGTKINLENLGDDPLYSDILLDPQVLLKDLFLPMMDLTDSTLARCTQGLSFRNPPLGQARILFAGDVREVQLFLRFSSATATVKARLKTDAAGIFSLTYTLTGPECVGKVSGELIEEIQITGTNVVLYRLHYDSSLLSGITVTAQVCGLRVEAQPLPAIPEGLTAYALPSMASYDENKVRKNSFAAGLRWNLTRNPLLQHFPQTPYAYNIYVRKGTAAMALANVAGPLMVSYPAQMAYDAPPGWPSERMFYIDGLTTIGTYEYELVAVDLFGRTSPPSTRASVVLRLDTPPPPVKVHAKYLDYATINRDGTCSDPHLTSAEITWLKVNRKSGIQVDFRWTTAQSEVCSAIKQFNIHYKKGWLNLYRGEINSTATASTVAASTITLPAGTTARYPALKGLTSYNILTFTATLEDAVVANGLRLSWLKQGYNSFLVLANTAGTTVTIQVLAPSAVAGGSPEAGKKFTAALDPSSAAFVDYGVAANWTDVSVTATVLATAFTLDTDGVTKVYKTVIKAPAFPNPAFVANESNPIRYAQMSVSTVNTELTVGAASVPASIVAVSRSAPSKVPAASINYGSALATPADAYGKSTFYYRWKKQGNGMKHFVYRTMDDALWRADLANAHSSAQYQAVATSLRITFSAADYAFASIDDYKGLSNNQMLVIANMPKNEGAFTRMHAAPIDEADTAYQNRVTDTPAPGVALGTADSSYLLYQDATLAGWGSNTYFYRLRTVDVAGNLSAFSQTSVPIQIPQVAPAVKPAITTIQGEERQIRIQWAQKSNSAIVGYLLYRSDDPSLAGDWRRMTLLKPAATDPYSVAAGAALEYVDASVVARTAYYYGVVAVTLDDAGNAVRSAMSAVVSGQAWDDSKPEITVLEISYAIDYDLETISLTWEQNIEGLDCTLARSPAWADGLTRLMTWDAGLSNYAYLDRALDLALSYQYQLTVRTANGQEADVKVKAEIIP
jgi:hypothetical protein